MSRRSPPLTKARPTRRNLAPSFADGSALYPPSPRAGGKARLFNGRAALRCALLALVVVSTAACSSRQDVLAARLRGQGIEHTYSLALERAWTVTRTLLKLEGIEDVDDHRSEGYVIAGQHAAGLDAGTYLGVFIEPGPTGTRVIVVSRRRSGVQSYPGLSEREFHHKFAELVAMADQLGVGVGCAPETAPSASGTPATPSIPAAPPPLPRGGPGLSAPSQ